MKPDEFLQHATAAYDAELDRADGLYRIGATFATFYSATIGAQALLVQRAYFFAVESAWRGTYRVAVCGTIALSVSALSVAMLSMLPRTYDRIPTPRRMLDACGARGVAGLDDPAVDGQLVTRLVDAQAVNHLVNEARIRRLACSLRLGLLAVALASAEAVAALVLS